jgi:hypothetical protein
MKHSGRGLGLRVEGVGNGFHQREKQTEQPDVCTSLRMPPTQEQKNDDEDRQGQQIGEERIIHQAPCFSTVGLA